MALYEDMFTGEEDLSYEEAYERAREEIQNPIDILDAFSELCDFDWIWKHLTDEGRTELYDKAVDLYFQDRFYEQEESEEEE